MGHVSFDPDSVKIEQFFSAPKDEPSQQQGSGAPEVVPLPSEGANAPVTKREVPPLHPPEAVEDLVKRDPKRIKRAKPKAIKGRKRPPKTVVLKPEKVEGRLCSAALPVKKQRSDALGFF